MIEELVFRGYTNMFRDDFSSGDKTTSHHFIAPEQSKKVVKKYFLLSMELIELGFRGFHLLDFFQVN